MLVGRRGRPARYGVTMVRLFHTYERDLLYVVAAAGMLFVGSILGILLAEIALRL